jgi:hypothetical protein
MRKFGSLLAAGLVALAAQSAAAASPPKVCGSEVAVPPAAAPQLRAFAERMKLRHPEAAVGTFWHVHDTGRLPPCYLTKRAAEARGWGPGRDLWRGAPGHSIGGDNFGNREGRIPTRARLVEADLDYAGGRRGAARLVFMRDSKGRWEQWVTMDHYESFVKVPAPRREERTQ